MTSMTTITSRWNRHAVRLLGAGLVAAVASTTMLTAQASPMGGGHRHGGAMMGGMHGERMLDAVDASAEQRSQIKQIMDAAQGDRRAQREAGRALHEQLRQLFTQPTVDARAVEALRVQMVARHDQASQRMMQAMLDVSRVLTPEQRTKLADVMAQRQARMERRGATQ
jgi:Spy/CpxP family protein refolding chaperone